MDRTKGVREWSKRTPGKELFRERVFEGILSTDFRCLRFLPQDFILLNSRSTVVLIVTSFTSQHPYNIGTFTILTIDTT